MLVPEMARSGMAVAARHAATETAAASIMAATGTASGCKASVCAAPMSAISAQQSILIRAKLSANDDRVAADVRAELRVTAALEQLLRFVQRSAQPEAQAQQTVARGIAPSGEDLVETDLACGGLLGQRCLGKPLLFQQAVKQSRRALRAEVSLIVLQKRIQVGRGHQLLLQSVCVLLFHSYPPSLQKMG